MRSRTFGLFALCLLLPVLGSQTDPVKTQCRPRRAFPCPDGSQCAKCLSDAQQCTSGPLECTTTASGRYCWSGDAAGIDAGDTAWMLCATTFVMIQTPATGILQVRPAKAREPGLSAPLSMCPPGLIMSLAGWVGPKQELSQRRGPGSRRHCDRLGAVVFSGL